MSRFALLAGATLVAAVLAPLVLNDFWVFVALEVVVFALYALTFNLLFGYGGMLPFGHAAFFGLGAYAAAILAKKAGVAASLALAASPFIVALAAIPVAFFCVRLTGIYLGMLSFAFQMLLYTVVLKWYSLTGGDDGLTGVLLDGIAGTPTGLYYLSLAVVVASIVLLWRLVESPFGKILQATRSNPQKSLAIGVNVTRVRVAAFAFSAFFAGLAGALFAFANQSVFPGWVNWTASAVPIVMTVLGGMHRFAGPILGAAIYVLLQTVLTGWTEYWALILGVLIIAIVMLLPNGVIGFLGRVRHG